MALSAGSYTVNAIDNLRWNWRYGYLIYTLELYQNWQNSNSIQFPDIYNDNVYDSYND